MFSFFDVFFKENMDLILRIYILVGCLIVVISMILVIYWTNNYNYKKVIEKIKMPGIVFWVLCIFISILFSILSGVVFKTNLKLDIKYNISYFLICIGMIPACFAPIKIVAQNVDSYRKYGKWSSYKDSYNQYLIILFPVSHIFVMLLLRIDVIEGEFGNGGDFLGIFIIYFLIVIAEIIGEIKRNNKKN